MVWRRGIRVLVVAASVAGGAALAGCSGPALIRPDIDPTKGTARLVLRRDPQVYGSALGWTVSFDGRPVARLRSGGTAEVEVPTGTHVVGLSCGLGLLGSTDETTIGFERGRAYEVGAFASLTNPCQLQLRRVTSG